MLTGNTVQRVYHNKEEVEKRYHAGTESPYFVLQLVAPTNLHDFSDCNHNELLNPGQRYFTPRSFEVSLKAVSLHLVSAAEPCGVDLLRFFDFRGVGPDCR